MTEFLIAYAYYPWLRVRLQGVMRRVFANTRPTETDLGDDRVVTPAAPSIPREIL